MIAPSPPIRSPLQWPRFTNPFARKSKVNPIPPIARITAQDNSPFLETNTSDYHGQADAYARSTWPYVAITRIAEACSLVPFEVYRLKGETRVQQIDHPLERLLRTPNAFTSGFELLESTFGFLELTGNAYWYLAGEPGGAPRELWPLRPDRVRIVPHSERYIGGYVYTTAGTEITLRPDEVIHFKRWSPQSDYYGLSAMEAAALPIQTDRAQQRWNYNFFSREKAVPAGIVTVKNMIDDASFERLAREFRETFTGTDRRTAFIRGADITWSDIGLSQRDSDFLASREFNKREIFQIFGLPAGLYDPNATQANATVARQTFLQDTIYPKLIRFGHKLTSALAPFFGPDLIVTPAPLRDPAAELAELQAASAYLSINEVRARYFNREPVAWGDRTAGADY